MFSALRVSLIASASPCGRSAVTITSSLADAVLSVRLTLRVLPAVTSTSDVSGAKPMYDTVSVYLPAGTSGSRYAPWPSETTLAPSGASCSSAPGTGAPLASVITPAIVPLLDCVLLDWA
jgi:hypothetical protein